MTLSSCTKWHMRRQRNFLPFTVVTAWKMADKKLGAFIAPKVAHIMYEILCSMMMWTILCSMMMWTILQVLDTSQAPILLGKPTLLIAQFINFNAVECPIPSHNQSYIINVTNNGKIYSEGLLFIPFDSRCNDCSTNTTTCVKKVCTVPLLLFTVGSFLGGSKQT